MTAPVPPSSRLHGQEAGPLRTWRPMAAWTGAILLALGLAWFVGAVAVPWWQVRGAARIASESEEGFLGSAGRSVVDNLGGPELAATRLRTYRRLPPWAAPYRAGTLDLLGCCGKPGVPALIDALGDADRAVRAMAAWHLGRIGPDAREATAALTDRLTDTEADVRSAAAEALKKIRGEEAKP